MTEQQTPASVVERLLSRRDHTFHGKGGGGYINRDGPEAAALIERLLAEREGLRGALEPFADVADEFGVCGDGQPIGVKAVSGKSDLNVGHLRRAAEAFK
jgi:hypothetical protein